MVAGMLPLPAALESRNQPRCQQHLSPNQTVKDVFFPEPFFPLALPTCSSVHKRSPSRRRILAKLPKEAMSV